MSQKDMFDPDLNNHLSELSEILGSQLSNKSTHVDRLKLAYPDVQIEIADAYDTWQALEDLESPPIRPEMDVAFYKMLSEQDSGSTPLKLEKARVENKSTDGVMRWFTPSRLAVAATFVIGMMIGQWMDFGGTSISDQDLNPNSLANAEVTFANHETNPSASSRIKGINEVKENESVDMKILNALNKVILNDPNVNVRLAAIETMTLFADMPTARTYLIEAIPHQQSSIVVLELAAVMIALEEKGSADEWNELLSSEELENDVKIHLKESLKTIL